MKVRKQARWIPAEEELETKLRALPDYKLDYLINVIRYVGTSKARYRQIFKCWHREYTKARKAEA